MGKEDKRFRKSRDKVDYYRRNRTETVKKFLDSLENPKQPATTGSIAVAPIVVTLFVVSWLFNKLDKIPGNRFFNITEYFYVNQSIKLVVLLTLITVIVTGVGRFVNTRSGFKIERSVDKLVDQTPVLGSVYNITKVTADTVMNGPEGFKKPAKIDINGLKLTAFRTGNKTRDGRDIVFMPTSPNITTGFVIEADPDMLEESGETAEQALTRILSAGFGASNKEDKDS
jgi:uncharacterized membrane protein